MGTTLTGNAENGGSRRWSLLKIAVWAAPALFMLAMLINNQLTDEEGWSVGDFIFGSVVFYGALAGFELVAKRSGSPLYRTGANAGIVSMVLLLWGNAAHGVTISSADVGYLGALAIGIVGLIVAQVRPAGRARAVVMVRTMIAAAVTTGLVSVAALIAGSVGAHRTTFEVVGITAFYVVLFAGSAWIFREAARGATEQDAP